MEVLIVSKTSMNNNMCCVGGLVLENNQSVRLLNRGNRNQPEDTPLQIGQVWNINFIPRNPIQPPHVEDIIVLQKTFVRNQNNLSTFIQDRGLVNWNGSINNLFDGLLSWTSGGSGYVNADAGQFPTRSTGYWIANQDLEMYESYGSPRYRYSNDRAVKFKGYQDLLNTIPAGTLIRVSLTRAYPINGINGCWLQLSGWYE